MYEYRIFNQYFGEEESTFEKNPLCQNSNQKLCINDFFGVDNFVCQESSMLIKSNCVDNVK